jgi:hypothetical protein
MTPAAISLGGGSTYGFCTFPFIEFIERGRAHSICAGGRAMKSLARPSFFRLFDLLVSITNPGLKRPYWTHDSVDFERERHSALGPRHGFVIEITTLTRPGRRGWSLMVIKEYWWAGEESKALKNLRWARPTSGQRGDILAWLRAQEAKIGHRGFIEDDAADDDEGNLTTLDDNDSA